MINNLLNFITAVCVLLKHEEIRRRYRAGTNIYFLEYKIAGCTFQLPFNYVVMVNNKYNNMEEEVDHLRYNNGALKEAVEHI